MVRVGQAVIYVDGSGKQRPAIVTAILAERGTPSSVGWFFVETDSRARVNVVFTSDDDTKNDKDGRQIEREIGVVHRDETPAKGGYWRHVDEKARATEWAD